MTVFAPIVRLVSTWYGALVAVALAAAVVIAVGLGRPGLWEPNELSIADRVVAKIDRNDPSTEIGKADIAAKAQQAANKIANGGDKEPPAPACAKVVPEAPLARSSGERALTWGITTFGMTDGGMRAPFAILGILCALAICGIAIRLGSPRAGWLAGLVGLSFPLLVLSSKQLTSEIATATGGAMLVYGLVALSHRRPPLASIRGILDVLLSLLAIAAGTGLAFIGGGALLGLLVPIGAVAASAGFGVPAIRRLVQQGVRAVTRRGQRIGAALPAGAWVGLLAAAISCGLLYILTKQMYSLKAPITGGRELLGKSIVPSGCYSSTLGAIWPPDDNLRNTYESSIEQIAFGTYPWGILAPLAVAGLLSSLRPGRRRAAALTLAWGAGAWIATEAFQRKVGFTIWAGFPALAVVVGVWLDGLLEARARVRDVALATAATEPTAESAGSLDDEDLVAADLTTTANDDTCVDSMAPANLQVGLFVALGMIVLGKDLQQFPQRLASLLVGNDTIKYPVLAKFAGLPTRIWILAIGGLIAGGFAFSMWYYATGPGPALARRRARSDLALKLAIAMTLPMALFWGVGWHRSLSANLSSKQIFATYRELRNPGDRLLLMGDLGNAPRYYADGPATRVVSYDKLFEQFADTKTRAFAMVPGPELCAMHREANGRPYFVLDDSNARSLLVSNNVAGATDHNPLATAVLRAEPSNITNRPLGKIIYDNRIEIIGWNIPPVVNRGSTFTVTLFYKVLQPIPGSYKVFFHIDGSGLRFNGDHEPIGGRCATSYWKVGDYIADTFRIEAGGATFPPGTYDVWVGFFTGSSPNWRNMTVSNAPADSRDNADRVRLLKLKLD